MRAAVLSALLAGLVAGLVSAPHCLGMCGPLAAFAAIPPARPAPASARPGEPAAASPRQVAAISPIGRVARPLRWQLGRLMAYALVGAIAGGAGAHVLRALAPAWMTTALSVALGLALLVAAWRLARPVRAAPVDVPTLGRRARTPLAARVLARAPREPLVLGLLTALLPCGALWSAALVAAAAGSWAAGALAMIGFALASGVALLVAGTIGARATARPTPAFRRMLAACMVVGAVITIARPIPQLVRGEPAACHAP